MFSSLRGERLPKRSTRTRARHQPKPSAKIYVANTQTPRTSKPQVEKFSSEKLDKEVGKSVDVIQVAAESTKQSNNKSISDNDDIIGVGTVELLQPEFMQKKPEMESTIPPAVTPPADTDSKPNFSGKISSNQKISSAFKADQEMLELTQAVDDISSDESFTLPSFVRQFLSSKEFDPQVLLERLRANTKFNLNATWMSDYKILSCAAQPFLHRLSIMGEFFEMPT